MRARILSVSARYSKSVIFFFACRELLEDTAFTSTHHLLNIYSQSDIGRTKAKTNRRLHALRTSGLLSTSGCTYLRKEGGGIETNQVP